MQAQAPWRLGLAAGIAAQTIQAVVLRETLQVARGGEIILGIALASWLVGSALGVWLWRRSEIAPAILSLVIPLALIATLRRLEVGFGGWAPAAALLAGAAGFGPGAYFGAVLRRIEPRRALVAEAAGAFVAGLLLSLLLLTWLNSIHLVGLAASILLIAVVPRLLVVFLCALVVAALGDDQDPAAGNLWPGSHLVRYEETPYARLHLLERGTQRALFANGQLALTFPQEIDAEAFANVVLAAHPAPRRVLVLGLAGAPLLAECRRHPVETLQWTYVDGGAADLLGNQLAVVMSERQLRWAAASAEWDVVLVSAPEPLTLAANRLYTSEFFESLQLAPGGFVAISLPGAATERETEVLARNVAVYRAMTPPLHVTVLPGVHDLLLGGRDAPPQVDPAILIGTLASRGIELKHHDPSFIASDFDPVIVSRATEVYRRYPEPVPPAVPFAVKATAAVEPAPEVRPNRDLDPTAVHWSTAALARREQVAWLAGAVHIAPFAPALLLAPALVGLLAAWRRRGLAAAALSAATTGAATMGIWVLLLVGYQARVGALYGDFAMLAGSFMAGYAAGARARISVRLGDSLLWIACIATILILPTAGRFTLLAWSVAVGGLGGASLAAIVSRHRAQAPALYAVDLTGAALAALIAGTLMLPALGAPMACAVFAALKLMAWLAPTGPARPLER